MLATNTTLDFSNPKGFLVLDGVNGAGKTTLRKKISAYLKQSNVGFIETLEPGATKLGQDLRRLLLESDTGSMSHLAETFLFVADRAEHVAQVVLPALEQGTVVISDRYYYSTIAFQGFGRELDKDFLFDINQAAIQATIPDFVILLDLDPSEGLKRTTKRNSAAPHADRDSFEEEDLAFHTRLREGFLHMAKTYQEPFLVIDATKSPEEIFAELEPALSKWIESLKR